MATTKKVTVKFYLQEVRKEDKAQIRYNNIFNKNFNVYCQVTFNRKTTRFSTSNLSRFKSFELPKEVFETLDFKYESDFITNAIYKEIEIIGEKNYEIKGLGNRLEFYTEDLLSFIGSRIQFEILTELMDQLTYNEFNRLTKFVNERSYEEINTKGYFLPLFDSLDIFFGMYFLSTFIKKDINKILSENLRKKILVHLKLIEFQKFILVNFSQFTIIKNFDWMFSAERKNQFKNFFKNNEVVLIRELEYNDLYLFNFCKDLLQETKIEVVTDVEKIIDEYFNSDEKYLEIINQMW